MSTGTAFCENCKGTLLPTCDVASTILFPGVRAKCPGTIWFPLTICDARQKRYQQDPDTPRRTTILESTMGSQSKTKKSLASRGSASDQFPGKLHDLLTYTEREDLSDVISWVRNGHAIMVHNSDKLLQLLPMFGLSQTKYRSFERQLYVNFWSDECDNFIVLLTNICCDCIQEYVALGTNYCRTVQRSVDAPMLCSRQQSPLYLYASQWPP